MKGDPTGIWIDELADIPPEFFSEIRRTRLCYWLKDPLVIEAIKPADFYNWPDDVGRPTWTMLDAPPEPAAKLLKRLERVKGIEPSS